MNATALEVLRRQLGKHRERVFPYAGKPLGHANTLARRKALKRAGIGNFRWHLAQKDQTRAVKVGVATWVGIMAGLVAKVVLAFIMVGIFGAALLI